MHRLARDRAYLIPTFSNPTGAVLPLERRREVLEIAARHRTLIVEDDPYGELYFENPPPPTLLALSAEVSGSRDWLVHCGSASKIIAPGLRVGWVVAPEKLLGNIVMCKQFSDTHASTLTQAVMTEYLTSGRLPAHLDKARRAYAERAAAMSSALSNLLADDFKFENPTGGLSSGDGWPSEAMIQNASVRPPLPRRQSTSALLSYRARRFMQKTRMSSLCG